MSGVAGVKDLVVEKLYQNSFDNEEFYELFQDDKIDVNFHFYHYLSQNQENKLNVSRYSRDAPIHMAIRLQSVELVDFLIKKGAKTNIKNGHGDTPSHLAARMGLKDILELLLKEDTDTEIKNLKGHTPLLVAIVNQGMPCIRLFKRFKANFYAIDNDSPLRYAILSENLEIIDYMLKNCPDISKQTDVWLLGRRKYSVGEKLMEFDSATGKYFEEFHKLSSRDKQYLVKFSTPWDVKNAIKESIDLCKLVELIRECLREEAMLQKEKSDAGPTVSNEYQHLKIRLNFLITEKKKRALFKLNRHIINILKSELKADRVAKLAKAGISFRKLSRLINRGGDMNMMNRLVDLQTISLTDSMSVIKTLENPEGIIEKITLVGNVKVLYKEITALYGDPAATIKIGTSLSLLGPKNTENCVKNSYIKKFVKILAAGSVETMCLKCLVDSLMEAEIAVAWVVRQNYKCLFSFLEIFNISELSKIPNNVIEILSKNSATAKKLVQFLFTIQSSWIKTDLLKNLKFLLESPVDGRSLALLFEAKMSISKSTSDSRYLNAISKLIKSSIDAEHVISLMEASRTIYRLIKADENLVENIAQFVNNLVQTGQMDSPVSQAAAFLKNCNESARLREILIDEHFNLTLINMLLDGIHGRLIGVFLSQTCLSIKETQTFSPDGVSLSRLDELDMNACFLTKFITAGFKVTDLGNIIRVAVNTIIENMRNMVDDEIDLLRNLIKLGVRSNELAVLIAAAVSIEEINEAAFGTLGVLELVKMTSLQNTVWKGKLDFYKPTISLIHPRYNTLNVFYLTFPTNLQFIQSEYNYNFMIPSGTVSDPTFISICRVPETSIGLKNDPKLFLSNPICVQNTGSPLKRKISVFYPISKHLPFEYARPFFYALKGDKMEQLETDIVNAKLMKVTSDYSSYHKLYCITEIMPDKTIILALEPNISHSLFRKGTEKLKITSDIYVSIDKQLVREKPIELIAKSQLIKADVVRSELKHEINFEISRILPTIQFTNARRMPHQIYIYYRFKDHEFDELVASIKNKFAYITIYQKNPSSNQWIDSTELNNIKFANSELQIGTKILSSILVIISSSKPHTDIENKLPPLILLSNHNVRLSLQIFQNIYNRSSFMIQYRKNEATVYDETQYKKINSFKVKVKPGQKMLVSVTNLIMKDEFNCIVSPYIFPQNSLLLSLLEGVVHVPETGTMTLKIANTTFETDISIHQEDDKRNHTLIQYFAKNISPKIPPVCYASFGLELRLPEVDIKHIVEFDRNIDAFFHIYLERRELTDVQKIVDAMRKVNLETLADAIEDDMKTGLWNKESDMFIL